MKVVMPNNRVFNVDKRDFYWKKLTSRTSIAREEKSMPDFKASKDPILWPPDAKSQLIKKRH